MNKRVLTIIGIAIVLVVISVVKLKSNKQKVQAKLYIHDTTTAILVNVAKPKFHSFENSFSYLGTFDPNKQNLIGSDVAGKIIRMNVQDGDKVSKGQILAKLDDEMLELQLENAAIQVESQKNDDARNNFLIKENAITGVQNEKTKLALKAAEANYKLIKKQFKNTSIAAPFSGVISKKMVDLGSVIGIGTPLFEITDISSVKLSISVPERDILKFKEGQKVIINVDVYDNIDFEGTVSSIGVKADASHNFKVEIAVRNSGKNRIMAGMYGSVKLQNATAKNALSISRKALVGSTKHPQLYVVRNGKAKLISFTAGTSDAAFIEVVDGLSATDVVIVKGQINLQNNSNVLIK